ncbi:hypothetical protein [Candidatus Ichthyocystis hellenicum]|uniref:hypothetical protein n=1 Tax=Candidatus Ichthyocystis hellenicum TaxID=1561003 RepID=UPI000A429CFC|nr:hypothetical protein [Candidatus Ichthyocystis hellenicum]
MSKIDCTPCTLLELSAKSVFGVSCKESVDCLMQLSHNEIFNAASLINRRRASFSMYETVLESNSSIYPFPNSWTAICKDNIHISGNCKELEVVVRLMDYINEITTCTDTLIKEDVSDFLGIISGGEKPESMKTISKKIDNSIKDLKKYGKIVNKSLYYLSMASLLQVKNSFLSLLKSLALVMLAKLRSNKIKDVDKILTCLHSFAEDVSKLKETIFHTIHICNFLPLEKIIKIFESKDSDLYKSELSAALSLLRKKYKFLIVEKKLKMKNLLEIIDQGNKDQVTSVTADKLRDEIREMELFLGDFTEEE